MEDKEHMFAVRLGGLVGFNNGVIKDVISSPTYTSPTGTETGKIECIAGCGTTEAKDASKN
jgi:hypothetical protein